MNLEEKLNALTTMVEKLSMTIIDLKNGTPQQIPPQHSDLNREDRTMRVDVPDFEGTSHDPEVYIEWEKGVDRYFEYKGTHLDQQYKIAKVKLIKLAATWLEGIQRQRVREDRPKITTWDKLKKHLRRRYIPSNYKQQLYISWSNLRQGQKSVADYIQEGERLSVLCNIDEPEELRVGRFLSLIHI